MLRRLIIFDLLTIGLWTSMNLDYVKTEDFDIVHPEIGIRIRHLEDLHMVTGKTYIVYKIPQVQPVPETNIPIICDLRPPDTDLEDYDDLNHQRQYGELTDDFEELCNKYESIYNTLQDVINTIRTETTDIRTDISLITQDLDFQHTSRTRDTRSVGSSIREFFGVAESRIQKSLMRRVGKMEENQKIVSSQVSDLTIINELQDKLIEDIMEDSERQSLTIHNITNTLRLMTDQFRHLARHENDRDHVNEVIQGMTRQILISGNLQLSLNQHLLILLNERLDGIHNLLKFHISPNLIPPRDILDSLHRLNSELKSQYSQYGLVHNSLEYYYTTDDVFAWSENEYLYVALGVPITAYEEDYSLYQLDSIPIRVHVDSGIFTEIMLDYNMVAVNMHEDRMLLINDRFLHNQCVKRNHYHCNSLLPKYSFSQSRHCESAIIQGDFESVSQNCKTRLLHMNNTDHQYVDIAHIDEGTYSMLMTGNASGHISCNNNLDKVFLQPFDQFVLACHCLLTTNHFSIPPNLNLGCIDMDNTYEIRTNNMNINSSFLNDLTSFVSSSSKGKRLSLLDLEDYYSDYVTRYNREPLGKINDLLDNIRQHNITQPSWKSVLEKGYFMSDSIEFNTGSIYVVISIIGILILLMICIMCKQQSIANSVALASTLQGIAPVKAENRDTYGAIDHYLIICSFVFIALIVVINCSKLLSKLYKKSSQHLGFNIENPHFSDIALILYSARASEIIYLDKIAYPSHLLGVTGIPNLIKLQLIKHTFSASLVIDWKDLVLIDKDKKITRHLPSTCKVNMKQYHTIKRILSENYDFQLVIGRSGIFFAHKINLAETDIYVSEPGKESSIIV